MDVTSHHVATVHTSHPCRFYLCIFLQTKNSTRISTLPDVKYAVTSRLFSKWDQVQQQCASYSLGKWLHSWIGYPSNQFKLTWLTVQAHNI